MGSEAVNEFMDGLTVFHICDHHVKVLEVMDIFFDTPILMEIHQLILSPSLFIYNAKLHLNFVAEIVKQS